MPKASPFGGVVNKCRHAKKGKGAKITLILINSYNNTLYARNQWEHYNMNFLKTFLTITVLSLTTSVFADTTSSGSTDNDQTNESGSNTTISGGYSSESSTTYADGSTNDTTSTTNTTTTNTSNASKQNVPTASAPSMSAYSQDICAVGRSGGLQVAGVGISGGTTVRDMNCERMKLSKLLNDYGMKVAAVAILCQDERVFEAMEQAGTPCPFEGRIGSAALAQWKKYDIERPDYEKYVSKMTKRLEVDERIMENEGILEENQSLKTDVEEVAKQNAELQKAISDLKKKQKQLIVAQQAEIERLESLVPVEDVVEVVEEVEEELQEPTVTTLDNGRIQIRIPI